MFVDVEQGWARRCTMCTVRILWYGCVPSGFTSSGPPGYLLRMKDFTYQVAIAGFF